MQKDEELADLLRQLFDYNPDTGLFTRTVTKNSNAKIGDIAGSVTDGGYITISIGGEVFRAHRLAWLYMYGEFPKNEIDHINHNRADNRICNLRDVTRKENGKNRALSKNNKSGVCGVSWYKAGNKWQAGIKIDHRRIHLGHFTKFHEAVNARKNAEVLYGFHENHGEEQ